MNEWYVKQYHRPAINYVNNTWTSIFAADFLCKTSAFGCELRWILWVVRRFGKRCISHSEGEYGRSILIVLRGLRNGWYFGCDKADWWVGRPACFPTWR
jgi:hypothetical protein